MGSSCFARGNNQNLKIIKQYLSDNMQNTAVHLTGALCQENCRKGPVIFLNDKMHNNVGSADLPDLLDTFFTEGFMLNPIYTEETECQDCYKCIRHCPVKSIKVKDGHAEAVSETALGAHEVSRHTIKRLNADDRDQEIFISSACPTMVEYIKKYQPRYSSYIAESLSPLQTHCQLLKQRYGQNISIIFAGPCISKKREADLRPDLLSLAISFEDLRDWLKSKMIEPSEIKTEDDNCFIPHSSRDGALYPSEGGMIRSIKDQSGETPAGRMLSFSDIHCMDEILAGLNEQKGKGPLFLELLACKGGCINGPASQKHIGTVVKQCLVNDYVLSLEVHNESDNLYCEDITYARVIEAPEAIDYTEDKIQRALRQIGKYNGEDEKNCGACGYSTCRDYARATLDGRAEKDMCISYLKKLSEKKSNALIKTMPSGVVIVDKHMRILECNSSFAELMGPETKAAYSARPGLKGAVLEKILPYSAVFEGVISREGSLTRQTFQLGDKIIEGSVFSIEKDHAVGGIFQDVTSPQVQKERIIRQAKQLMEKSIESVQQIAFLLGENAAESEVMLNTIIESFSSDGKNE